MSHLERTFIIGVLILLSFLFPQKSFSKTLQERLFRGIIRRQITFKLTTEDELKAILGNPQNESPEKRDGGLLVKNMYFNEEPSSHIEAVFARFTEAGNDNNPFVIRGISINGKYLNIGQDSRILIKNAGDLEKLDTFDGLQNIDLSIIKIPETFNKILKFNFDTFTKWPKKEFIPSFYDPEQFMIQGKNPGLNIDSLHKKGVDGRGIHIAIIDQPLLTNHEEICPALFKYTAISVQGISPTMHSAAVAGIAVGKTSGVAPKAMLHFYAIPMWKDDNKYFVEALKDIFTWNKNASPSQRIRVVSISSGIHEKNQNFDFFRFALEEAKRQDILVLTTKYPETIRMGGLIRNPGANPNDILSYTRADWSSESSDILIPVGGRTIAGEKGVRHFKYDPNGGLSWGIPYVSGLAALAFQVNPELSGDNIIQKLKNTAIKCDQGCIINPIEFIKSISPKGKE